MEKKEKRTLENVELSDTEWTNIMTNIHDLAYVTFSKLKLTIRECSYITGLNTHVFTDTQRNYRLKTLVLKARMTLCATGRTADGRAMLRLFVKACMERRSVVIRVIDDGEPLRKDEILMIGPRRKRKK